MLKRRVKLKQNKTVSFIQIRNLCCTLYCLSWSKLHSRASFLFAIHRHRSLHSRTDTFPLRHLVSFVVSCFQLGHNLRLALHSSRYTSTIPHNTRDNKHNTNILGPKYNIDKNGIDRFWSCKDPFFDPFETQAKKLYETQIDETKPFVRLLSE